RRLDDQRLAHVALRREMARAELGWMPLDDAERIVAALLGEPGDGGQEVVEVRRHRAEFGILLHAVAPRGVVLALLSGEILPAVRESRGAAAAGGEPERCGEYEDQRRAHLGTSSRGRAAPLSRGQETGRRQDRSTPSRPVVAAGSPTDLSFSPQTADGRCTM